MVSKYAEVIFLFEIKSRCVILGQYIAEHNATVRETAAVFGVSKSTVHKDVTEKLFREAYDSIDEETDHMSHPFVTVSDLFSRMDLITIG